MDKKEKSSGKYLKENFSATANDLCFQGLTFTAQGVEDGLFIKEMIPMAGSNSFGFSGPMEDVWTALQVE